MNANEAKTILQLYRPGTTDAEDPQIAAALALAKQSPELAAWLKEHCARQEALRAKFREITPPAGLKEQIISEHAANERRIVARQKIRFALAVVLLLFGALAVFWFPRHAPENTLAIFQNQMVRVALSPYGMNLPTNEPASIRTYLAEQHAPADFVLPAPLQRTTLTGCAVENWQGAKVSMICFHTGKPLPSGTASDLWLFVVDRAALDNAPDTATPRITKVNRLITATWTRGGKLYLLGIEGNEPDLERYL